MPVQIDFDGVSTSGFTPLENGNYPATVTKIELSAGQQSGAPVINAEFTLTELNGRKHWETYSLQANSLWRLKTAIVDLGLEPPSGPMDEQALFEWMQSTWLQMDVVLEITKEPHWNKPGQFQNRAALHPAGTTTGESGQEASGW